MRSMFTRERDARSQGKHFRADGAFNNPKPIRGDIPILIGGSGERKTLRLVAQYGDGCNLFAAIPSAQRTCSASWRRHCADVGRDSSEITKTAMGA